MKGLIYYLLAFSLIVVVASCSDDDASSVPSYRTDLLCAITDADSMVTHLRLDDGITYRIGSQRIKAPLANAQVRCLASYEISTDSTVATVYSIARITCYAPLPVDSFQLFPRDPVNVISTWKTPDYINLCFAPLVNKDVRCQYDFCVDSIISRTLHVSMLFEKTDDAPDAYSAKIYHSIPLTSPDYQQEFDTLILYITTYDGVKTCQFRR